MNTDNALTQLLGSRHKLPTEATNLKRYAAIGLKFNPFPKSGTANIVSNDSAVGLLSPPDEEVQDAIASYLSDALYSQGENSDDKFLSAVIIGDYGSEKKQLLIYVNHLLSFATESDDYRKPFVIYIDNPGVKLAELIGSIISKVGEENFRKYLWNKIIRIIKSDDTLSSQLNKFKRLNSLFQEEDPYSDNNSVSYKLFLDNWLKGLTNVKQKKEFDDTLQTLIITALNRSFNDSVITEYFYELISSDYASNKTWEAISSGSSRRLDGKYVEIINAIVSLVKEEGYTDFFILVDEFEDITQGRLNKTQIDNYFSNLRTLIDNQRHWCLLFAMTSNALQVLKSYSPPLAERIAARTIRLSGPNKHNMNLMMANYLRLAREGATPDHYLWPFEEAAIDTILAKSANSVRVFLRNCFSLIESFVKQKEFPAITPAFIEKHLP